MNREQIASIIDPQFRDPLALSLNEWRTEQALAKADQIIAGLTLRGREIEPRFQALRGRLLHAITTSSNDDRSEPMTSLRLRHTERVAALYVAIDFIDSVSASPPEQPAADPVTGRDALDRAAFQLFLLDNNASRWPSVNQDQYRREAKSILDAAFPTTDPNKEAQA